MNQAPLGASPSPARSAAGMGAAAGVSRIFGGARMVVIAAVLGTTYLGNTFQAANSVSNVLFELLAAGALSAVLVPTFVALLARNTPGRAEEVAGRILGVALVVLGVVTALGVILAPSLAALLTTGVDDPAVRTAQEELTTFLLRFFVPQVLLYAVGAVATAVLHAHRRFVLAALAPVGNTIVLVVTMMVFRSMAGPNPGLDLTLSERLTLALGGTLGVVAFVAAPTIGLRVAGFRLRPRLRSVTSDTDVRHLGRLSGWAAVQHSGTGLLLAAALVAAGGVAGGVVAYQLAFVVFLAPYGLLAQPILTTALPRLATAVANHDDAGFRTAFRWAFHAMAVATLPAAALLIALSAPVMGVLAFGAAQDPPGPQLLGQACLGLAVGIPVYGAFLLLTRAAYALGDSRTPALAAVGSALVGAGVMVAAFGMTHGTARLAMIGVGHSVAYALGALWLGHRLAPRVGPVLVVGHLRPLLLSLAIGLGAWGAMTAWSPVGRWSTVAALAVVGGGSVAIYLSALQRWGVGSRPSVAPEEGLA